jgi:thiol-disulfide isomerase/thioredoxin
MTRRSHLIWISVIVLALLAGAGLGYWRAAPKTDVPPANWVFELQYPQMLDGKTQTTPVAAHRGPLTVINFWATWCAPCIEEMPELSRVHKDFSPDRANVIGLAVDSPSNVKNFLEQHQISYPILLVGAAGTDLAKRLGARIDALPFTVVIDQKGVVRHQKLGRIREEELRSWLKEGQ